VLPSFLVELSLIFTFVGLDVCGAGISPEYGVLGFIVEYMPS
jgi:hypothetical protein